MPRVDSPNLRSLARSRAFLDASLRSEVRRAWAVIGVIALIFLLVFVRHRWHDIDPRLVVASLIGVGMLFLVQVAALALARRVRMLSRPLPTWFMLSTLVIESLIPTGIMAANIWSGALSPHASLVSPPLLANGIMVILMALRLRPWMCILAGSIAALGYAALLAYITFGLNIPHPTTGLPQAAYVTTAILLFVAGLAAAWVAHEIRGHLDAALREVETREQMSLIEQDLAVARSIQQALIPHSAPTIPGYEIAGWNRPADQTGGDYYDWQPLPDGNWIITLADVSGHGIGPAMVTAACRAYVRASVAHHGDLSSLAARVNRLLADDLPDGRFVTMAGIILDPRGGPLALLSAGHGPIVLLLGASGEVRDILPGDLPLAVAADTTFGPHQSLDMSPGDVLALVTDGFVEWSRFDATGNREQFGLQRLRDSLRRHAALAPAAMIQAITADVEAFAGAEPQQDDLTMVVIRRR
jgi:serine phosphatase RsbU (regulator of sigma subunit)